MAEEGRGARCCVEACSASDVVGEAAIGELRRTSSAARCSVFGAMFSVCYSDSVHKASSFISRLNATFENHKWSYLGPILVSQILLCS